MSCVLRISATDVRTASLRTLAQPYRVEGGTAHFIVSNAEFSAFAAQVSDAIAFLQANAADLRTLMGVDQAKGVLDFAVEWRDVGFQCDTFPSELVREAGAFGLALEMSHYPAEDSSSQPNPTFQRTAARPLN